MTTTPTMPYRRLGPTGLKVSVLSFGSWVSFGTQLDTGMARDCLAAAREAGVNFFDNAEAYAGGESERIMGRAISELNWPRETYVVSSKFFWGLTEGVNTRNTLNRKYLMHAIDGSLERFGLDFLDVDLLPPARPGDAGRGDRRGDVGHHRVRPGALLGRERVVGRRDPRRVGRRRQAQPAQAGHRAAAVPPVRAAQGGA